LTGLSVPSSLDSGARFRMKRSRRGSRCGRPACPPLSAEFQWIIFDKK
jgi:hypothetical protein